MPIKIDHAAMEIEATPENLASLLDMTDHLLGMVTMDAAMRRAVLNRLNDQTLKRMILSAALWCATAHNMMEAKLTEQGTSNDSAQ